MKLILKNKDNGETITLYHVLETNCLLDRETGEETHLVIYMNDGFYVFNCRFWFDLESDHDYLDFPDYDRKRPLVQSFIKDNQFLNSFLYSYQFFTYGEAYDTLEIKFDYITEHKKTDRFVIQEHYCSESYEKTRSIACCIDLALALTICRAMDTYREPVNASETNPYFYTIKQIDPDYVDYLDFPQHLDEVGENFESDISSCSELPF